jgi:hypothetical protein
MLVDRTGAVWLQTYRPRDMRASWTPTFPEPDVWQVYDHDGVWLGLVELPARFYPQEIGDDYVLGVWRDDTDVEYVRLYQLRKARSARR